MKAINFHFGETMVSAAWARLAFAEIFGRFQPEAQAASAAAVPNAVPRPPRISLFDRLDGWAYRAQLRERETWLSGAQDVFELESRIRNLERSVGSRYY